MLKIDLPFPFLGVSHQSKGSIKKTREHVSPSQGGKACKTSVFGEIQVQEQCLPNLTDDINNRILTNTCQLVLITIFLQAVA